MTTRHTITHADELYRGNAFFDDYTPDGRRGVEMSHLVLYHFQTTADAAPANYDGDGLVKDFRASAATGVNINIFTHTTSMAGALVTTGATQVILDVARNLVARCSVVSASSPIHIVGTDLYGNVQYEIIKTTTAGATVQGVKAFKTITNIYVSSLPVTTIQVGTGNKFGLPFHITHKGKVAGVYVDGVACTHVCEIGTNWAATTSTPTASAGALDTRGTVQVKTAPDGTKRFAVLMEVDASTRYKAFGQLPATAHTVTEV